MTTGAAISIFPSCLTFAVIAATSHPSGTVNDLLTSLKTFEPFFSFSLLAETVRTLSPSIDTSTSSGEKPRRSTTALKSLLLLLLVSTSLEAKKGSRANPPHPPAGILLMARNGCCCGCCGCLNMGWRFQSSSKAKKGTVVVNRAIFCC